MLFKEPRGLEKPRDVQFREFTTWIQCHNLPVACMNPQTIQKIGEIVGRVEEIDAGEGRNCLGQYAKVRVTRDIDKPLQRCVGIQAGALNESQTILIRYERLPEFCTACGRVGHVVRFCQDQEVDRTKKAFRMWLKAVKTVDLRKARRLGFQREVREGSSLMKSTEKEVVDTERGAPGEVGHNRESEPPTIQRITAMNVDEVTPEKEKEIPSRCLTSGKYVEVVDIIAQRGGPNHTIKGKGEDGIREEEVERARSQYVGGEVYIAEPKDKTATKGWKRRARGVNKGAYPVETGNNEGGVITARTKRGSVEEDMHDLGRTSKHARTEIVTKTHEDITAKAARQPRRSP